jgi:SAM-dependent methyltransferase
MRSTARSSRVSASGFHSGAHLREDQLEPAEKACPLCRSDSERRPALRLQADPTVDLLWCASCGGYSASRMPTSEALRSYYSNYYGDADERVTFDLPQRLARHIVAKGFGGAVRTSIEVLDFGGGDAGVSRAIAKLLLDSGTEHAHIHLVDFNAEVPPPDSSRISVDRVESLNGVAESGFDLVIASAILEHIPRPMEDLALLLRALREGGILYVRTPSVVPVLKLLGSLGLRLDFTFPAHLHDLGETFWRGVLERLSLRDSFEVVDSRPALVETTFGLHPLRTAAAYLLKAPRRLVGSSWRFVGGWEVFFRRKGPA